MTRDLAILTSSLGVPSQTFVRRHIERLHPGRTVVVADRVDRDYDGWGASIPTFVSEQAEEGLAWRAGRAVARRLGRRTRFATPRAAERFLKGHAVTVAMGEHLDWSLTWVPIARRLGIRYFAHAHGVDVSLRLRQPKWCRAYLEYNSAGGVITMSRVSRDRLVGIGLDPSKVHVVPYGVDVPEVPPTRAVRAGLRCLAVGRMVAKKAPILMLDAFRRCADVDEAVRLDVVGDGPLLSAARHFVSAFQLESRVTFHGALSHAAVLQLMTACDVLVHHSVTADDGNEEGLPVVILEAMASGLPVVSTRHAGIPEAVAHGETGYLVDEGDSKGMADHLWNLAQDASRRTSLGAAAWKRAADLFSWDRERDELRRILHVDESK